MGSKVPWRILFQPDYVPSAQFAGLAVASSQKLFAEYGLDVVVQPPCLDGDEVQLVLDRQIAAYRTSSVAVPTAASASALRTLSIGCSEPYVLAAGAAVGAPIRVFGAMLARSPFALLGHPNGPFAGGGDLAALPVGARIGAGKDTLGLVRHALRLAGQPDGAQELVAVERLEKVAMLASGELDAMQCYAHDEALALAQLLGEDPARCLSAVVRISGVDLGPAQALFAPSSALALPARRAALRHFLEALAAGWRLARSNESLAIEAVARAREELGLPREEERERLAFAALMPYLPEDPGNLSVDPQRWAAACHSLRQVSLTEATGNAEPTGNGTSPGAEMLDNLTMRDRGTRGFGVLDGLVVAERLKREAHAVAAEVTRRRHGRAPHLAVVRAAGAEGVHGPEEQAARLAAYGDPDSSWFDKRAAAKMAGIQYQEVIIEEGANVEAALAAVGRLNADSNVDAVLIELPLPASLSGHSAELFASIDPRKDVEGVHPVSAAARRGQLPGPGLRGAQPPVMPTCAAGVMALLDDAGVELEGKVATVLGRSRLHGIPVTEALAARGAVVVSADERASAAASARAVGIADVVVALTGVPDVVPVEAIRPKAVVVVVGGEFSPGESDGMVLRPDISHEASARAAMTPLPHGVGPTAVQLLLLHTAKLAAWSLDQEMEAAKQWETMCNVQSQNVGTSGLEPITDEQMAMRWPHLLSKGWELVSGASESKVRVRQLRRTISVASHAAGLHVAQAVARVASQGGHDPLEIAVLSPACGSFWVVITLGTHAAYSPEKGELQGAATIMDAVLASQIEEAVHF